MAQIVEKGLLETVAAERPSVPKGQRKERRGAFDLAAWIEEHEVPIKREGAWNRDGYRWVLEACPWNGHTDNSCYIVRFADGAISAGCHHSSCQDYKWRDLRAHYERPSTSSLPPIPSGDDDALPPLRSVVFADMPPVCCRLAELELAAGEKPRPGDVSLPEGTPERVREWAEGEEAKEREREELIEDLSQAMKAPGHDPTPIPEVMGGCGLPRPSFLRGSVQLVITIRAGAPYTERV